MQQAAALSALTSLMPKSLTPPSCPGKSRKRFIQERTPCHLVYAACPMFPARLTAMLT